MLDINRRLLRHSKVASSNEKCLHEARGGPAKCQEGSEYRARIEKEVLESRIGEYQEVGK